MKSSSNSVLMGAVLILAHIGSMASVANAQSVPVTSIPLPPIEQVPAASSNEQKTHDGNSIQQLMYVVELSRLIAGGISQLFNSSQSMTSLLGLIRDTANAQLTAVTGTKTIPLANTPGDIASREGGPSLRELAIEGLEGAVAGPKDVATAFLQFTAMYKLNKAFDFRNRDSLTQVAVAHMASHGAVAAATAENSYKSANESMGRLNGYITALATSPDIKTSLDINARVNIELIQQMNELLRSQAALTTLAGFYFMSAASVQADSERVLNFDNFNRDFK